MKEIPRGLCTFPCTKVVAEFPSGFRKTTTRKNRAREALSANLRLRYEL